MLAFAQIIDEKTKRCNIGDGDDKEFYTSIGMTEQEVEQAWNGAWYISGFAPEKPYSVTAKEEINDLKSKLSETDYIVIKIAEGVATPQEYEDVILNRAEWRKQINILEQNLE